MSILAILEGSAFTAGIAMGAASMLSIGPNNIMLMKEGLMRGRPGLVAFTVWASYLVLLGVALALTDEIATKGASIRPFLGWTGWLTLSWFAAVSLRAYFRSNSRFGTDGLRRETAPECVRRALRIVWLNPLVYLELLFLPATMGCNFVMSICRILFVAGLFVMLMMKCYVYTFAGGLCASLFRRTNMMRVFDLSSGIILTALSVLMAVGLVLRPS